MTAERLYEKVMAEADCHFAKQWKKERLELVQRKAQRPATKSEECRKQLSQLRSQTVAIERELAAIAVGSTRAAQRCRWWESATITSHHPIA